METNNVQVCFCGRKNGLRSQMKSGRIPHKFLLENAGTALAFSVVTSDSYQCLTSVSIP